MRNRQRQKNPLSLLSQWKLFDNLRRSLVPSALTLLLLLGWTILYSPWFWTVSMIGIILIPSFLSSILDLLQKPRDVLLRQHLAATGRSIGRRFAHDLFTLLCLPYEAFFSLDAVVRTTWRMLITHKRLLEWSPSGDPDRKGRTDLAAVCRTMWFAPFLAVSMVIYLALSNPDALGVASPLLMLWLASPVIAWWISRPLTRPEARLTASQTLFLRKLSRKTWAFFETFVGTDDNWLPPDNYQEYRTAVVAHRTSPTNMGLALLANLSAYDFGYISAGQLIKRTENALRTMEALDRHLGHFYNWYDTQSLKPLLPAYISTVDSGNLAAYLLTLRQGLLALPDQKILHSRSFDGLSDTLQILVDVAGGAAPTRLAQLQNALESAYTSPPTTLAAARLCLDQLTMFIAEAASDFDSLDLDPENQAAWWAHALVRQCQAVLEDLALLASSFVRNSDEIPTLRELASIGNDLAVERITAIEKLVLRSGELSRMEYDFLFDRSNHLLAIGYNVDNRRRDTSYYDLLASEARLCSFVGIAQGQLPQENWFALGRLLTIAGGGPVLLSWSGSMFEYLMPLLVMPTYENTLLDQTCKAAVAGQIEYGRLRGVPWGMSESGYNAVDTHLDYQYRAFGVPGLGLKRGLADDLVIAPYASALALMVAPEAACLNLQRLAAKGYEGKFGFFEAIDYTPSRQRRGQSSVIVRSFMAHHQGMSFLSLASVLLDQQMQKRFESDPEFQATMLLLQERVPKTTAFYSHTTELSEIHTAFNGPMMPMRVLNSPDTTVPEVQLLSNGRYHVMITNAGGGYSRWKDIAVTRWREDSTRDNWGTFCYIRDVASGEFWSTTYQPTLKRPRKYEAIFSEARAEFRRTDNNFEMHTEISVSPEDDIELRRITITNHGRTRREIEITSYAEVVLAPPRQTRCIRHSAIFLFRQRSSLTGGRSSAPVVPVPRTSTRPGCSISWLSTGQN